MHFITLLARHCSVTILRTRYTMYRIRYTRYTLCRVRSAASTTALYSWLAVNWVLVLGIINTKTWGIILSFEIVILLPYIFICCCYFIDFHAIHPRVLLLFPSEFYLVSAVFVLHPFLLFFIVYFYSLFFTYFVAFWSFYSFENKAHKVPNISKFITKRSWAR